MTLGLLLFALPALLFWVELAVRAWTLAVVGVAHVILVGWHERRRPCAALALVLAAWGVLGASALLSTQTTDMSFDGWAYQGPAVALLAEGWNPVTHPGVDGWRATASIDPHRFRVEHLGFLERSAAVYPKAGWVMAATIATVTGSFESGKAPTMFFMGAAFLVALRFARLIGIPWWLAALGGAVVTLNPVSVVQATAFLVDGVLAALLAAMILSGLAWLLSGHPDDLLIAVAAAVVALNLKFTGLVFAVMILAAIVGYAYARDRVLPWSMPALITGSALIALVSYNPYVTNFVNHGHPFYPLDRIALMQNQLPEGFWRRNRLTKLVLSNFSRTQNAIDRLPQLKLPLSVSRSEIDVMGWAVDTRIGGFGPLFGAVLIGSLVAGVLALAGRCWSDPTGRVLLLGLGVIAVTYLAHPEAWWARYVPQLWLLPPFCGALAWRAGWRIVPGALLGLVLLDLALVVPVRAGAVWRERAAAREEDRWLAGLPAVRLVLDESRYWAVGQGIYRVATSGKPLDIGPRPADLPCQLYRMRVMLCAAGHHQGERSSSAVPRTGARARAGSPSA